MSIGFSKKFFISFFGFVWLAVCDIIAKRGACEMEEKTGSHVYYLDDIRLFACISVIYMHVAAAPLRMEICADWHIINVFTCLGFTAVPLFFMVSGYLLLSGSKARDISLLFRKRLPRLVVPLAGWSVVAILWTMILTDQRSAAYFLESLASVGTKPAYVHLWYIYTLTAMYMIAPVLCGGLQSLDRKGHVYVLAIILLLNLNTALRTLLPHSFGRLPELDILRKLTFFDGHLCAFLLGFYLGNTRKRIPNGILLLLAAGLLSVMIWGTWQRSVQNGGYTDTFQNQSSGFSVLLAGVLFLLFKQTCDRPRKWLTHSAVIPLSLGIYFMHNIFLSMMQGIRNTITFPDTVLFTVINIAGCVLVLKTVATIRPLCYLATGMTFQQACESCNWIYTIRRIRARRR